MDIEAATLEVWKATIDVQKHFNELGLRVRSLAVTVLGALLAAAGYALRDKASVDFLGQQVSLSGMILLSALVCWVAFYVMDRLWYHRLLRAAVQHGRSIEDALCSAIPTIGLTTAIDEASPLWGLRAGHRLSIFYGFVAILLWLGAGSALGANSPYYVVGFVVVMVAFGLELSSRSASVASKRRGFTRMGTAVGALYFGWWGLMYWAASSEQPEYLKMSSDAVRSHDWHMGGVWMEQAGEAGSNMIQSILWGAVVPIIALLITGFLYWLYRGFHPRTKVVPDINK